MLLEVEKSRSPLGSRIELPYHRREELYYNALQAQDAGLIEAKFAPNATDFQVLRLTYAGHEFLDAISRAQVVERATEQRWVGTIEPASILLVVCTFCEQHHEEVIGVISARAAESHERGAYKEAYEGAEARHPDHRETTRPRHLISRMLPRFHTGRFFFQDPGAHKNTWITTKVDLSSVPHLGVARDSVTHLFCLRDRSPCFGSAKAIRPKRIRTGLGR
jgi:uncharacterized DUF497 family protein